MGHAFARAGEVAVAHVGPDVPTGESFAPHATGDFFREREEDAARRRAVSRVRGQGVEMTEGLRGVYHRDDGTRVFPASHHPEFGALHRAEFVGESFESRAAEFGDRPHAEDVQPARCSLRNAAEFSDREGFCKRDERCSGNL